MATSGGLLSGNRHATWRKYEADGGPGIVAIARILQQSEAREQDLRTLLMSQLLFWLLGATDGHAKNYSIVLLPGGRFQLTPLYDVLSAWPVSGVAPNKLDPHRLKLAMALKGKNTHYRLRDIQRRHFNHTATLCGWGNGMTAAMGSARADKSYRQTGQCGDCQIYSPHFVR